MRAAALLLLLGGCDQLFNLDHLPPPDPQSDVDAALGVIVDAPSACPGGTFVGKNGVGGTGLLEVCVPSNVPATLDLPTTIDTSVAGQCDTIIVIDSYGTEACVKWAALTRVTSVQATGPRALVLVATNTLSVSGTVDVSSTHTGMKGAGGNWGGCQANDGVAGSTTTGSTGGSGGAGGSFSTRGGNGGANGAGQYTGARTTALADRVRGGCGGGTGGIGPGSSEGGLGGRSGGAVYFIAGTRLEFGPTAIVNASGAGGKGGAGTSSTYAGGAGGGGGGGSGGLIGLDAPAILVDANAKLFANGGGGGGGGATTGSGVAGAEPSSATINTSAAGGMGAPTYGGRGGAGAATSGAGYAGINSKSGGGGGGGLGYIVAYTTGPAVTTGKFSPALLPQ